MSIHLPLLLPPPLPPPPEVSSIPSAGLSTTSSVRLATTPVVTNSASKAHLTPLLAAAACAGSDCKRTDEHASILTNAARIESSAITFVATPSADTCARVDPVTRWPPMGARACRNKGFVSAEEEEEEEEEAVEVT